MTGAAVKPEGARPSQPPAALELWRQVTTSLVSSEKPDLTTRQIALYLTIYLDQTEHNVRGLARKLGVQKPVISRALDKLGQLGFIRRERDQRDRRNVLIHRTVKGAVFLSEFADMVTRAANPPETR